MVALVWQWAYGLGLAALCATGLVALGALTAFLTRLPRTWGRATALTVLVLTGALVLVVTLRPYPGAHMVTYQPVPLVSLLQAISGHGSTAVNDRIQLAGNVLMFAPIGLALAHLQPVRRTSHVLAWTLGASLSIELLQALAKTGRSVDVNDVLLNVTGAALGVVVHDLVRRRGNTLRGAQAQPTGVRVR